MDCGALAVLAPKYSLDEDCLERLFLDAKVRNSKLMIVSTTGYDLNRNSFLLKIFLKYLNNLGRPDWLDTPDDPRRVFEWGENHPHPSPKGIFLWSKPFFIKVPSGEEVCILLMDSHTFIGYDNPENNIFLTLTSLLSSVLIFSPANLVYLLEQYKFIIDYGKVAMEVFKEKPFQTFFFLPHSGSNCNYQPGFEGGEEFWHWYFKVCYSHDIKFVEQKETFLQCFKDIQCYHLKYPWLNIFQQIENFRLYMSGKGMNPDYKSCLKTLTEHIFDPQNIVIKEINGKQVTGMELLQYFKSYTKALYNVASPSPMTLIKAGDEARKLIASGDHLPSYWSLIEKTEEAWNLVCVDKAEDYYRNQMNKQIYDSSLYFMNHEILAQYHQKNYDVAMIRLWKLNVTEQIFKDELSKRLLELYENYKRDLESFKADPILPSHTCAFADGKLIVSEIKKCQ